MVKLISWNIAHRDDAWRMLVDSNADIALLQEAAKPPTDIAGKFDTNPTPCRTAGAGLNRPWRKAVVRISNRVSLEWLQTKSIEDALPDELAVSRVGTLAAAIVTGSQIEPFIVASIYAPWENPHNVTKSNWIYADGSVHRLMSDLSSLIGKQNGHRIVMAGDLNILYGYGEFGSAYWASRYATVFSRMSALGLTFVGPQVPDGRQADPWPDELPLSSSNVPTFHSTHQTPTTATRQLDFVFASNEMAENVHVKALNSINDWGPSDHCRVQIELEG